MRALTASPVKFYSMKNRGQLPYGLGEGYPESGSKNVSGLHGI
jgi:hypothetical protein